MQAITPDPLDVHFPSRKTVTLSIGQDIKVNLPALKPPPKRESFEDPEFDEFTTDTLEWLSMVLLDSPRLCPEDSINSYLSRYQPPGETAKQELVKVTWQGFISPAWAHQSFVGILLAVPDDSWFAYSVSGFAESWQGGIKNSMILKVPETQRDYMLWEVA